MMSFKAAFAALVWAELAFPAIGLVVRQDRDTHDGGDTKSDGEEANAKLHTCLNGKRIIFIGPSTSKFDYMATAYFAEYGRWPTDPIVFNKMGAPGPNPLNEQAVHKVVPHLGLPPVFKPGCTSNDVPWESYMRYSNGLFNGREKCDCYRHGIWEGPYDMYNSTENRVYDNGNTMLAYFQWFGNVVLPRGTFNILPLLSQPAYDAVQQCPVGQYPGQWSWGMDMEKFLSVVVRYAKPTHLVLSTAFWPIDLTDAKLWEGIGRAGVQAVMDTGGQVIWRNTPQRADSSWKYASPRLLEPAQASMLKRGWKFFDAQARVNEFKGDRPWQSVFYDTAHLQPAAECHLAKTFLTTYVCPELR